MTELSEAMELLERKLMEINKLGAEGDLNNVPKIEGILEEIKTQTRTNRHMKNAWNWMQEWERIDELFLSDPEYKPEQYVITFLL